MHIRSNILCIANPKGGTGNTTVASNITACFALFGKTVLLIDIGRLGMLSKHYQIKSNTPELTISIANNENIKMEQCLPIYSTYNKLIDIIPQEVVIAADLSYPIAEDNILKEVITKASDEYDLIIIDTSREDIKFELALCGNLLITVSDHLSIEGINRIAELFAEMDESDQEFVQLRGVMQTRFYCRSHFDRELKIHLSQVFRDRYLENTIPNNADMQRSFFYGTSIFEYKPDSSASAAYVELTKELMTKWGI